MIRLFAGLSIPDDHRRTLATIQNGVKDARWIDPENLHITLRFIGEVDEDVAAQIALALGDVTAEPFEVTLKGVGTFGSPPHSLWVGTEDAPSGALAHLYANVESALVRTGLEPEGRKFTPHVTLTRFRRSVNPGRLAEHLSTHAGFCLEPFRVQGFTLFESHLGHKGAHYTPFSTYDLHRNT
ncbi:RNA 2',3'-cyclic phosphodiesterase [Magnetovibrio blakemorei]|uniref:RNA 2',3'-cyclic phosphodiesterase n=1 Tax=Magnetovibrio blakemorei TaxID=28181 RepID=A0A1E5Q7D2_9PROT|nr:RNA 2',3'-cyclic phosphodiesterase [Magnetovibrio blakemorei]OEJ67059.1 2'-5' RNA ligase [Magnetovibrio blakemorei]